MLRKKQVDAYIEEILKYNSVHNLVKRSSKEQIYKEDILDIFFFLDHFKEAKNILDIGTGAGIPGMVLAIHLPETQITLAEKNQKKAHFLEKTVKKLNIPNVVVFNESINKKTQLKSFSHITARALSEIEKIINTSLHLLEKGGEYLLFKGKKETVEKEIAKIKKYKTEVFKNNQTDKQRHLVRITINTQ